MKNSLSLSAKIVFPAFLLAFALTGARAASMGERFQASVNTMVQNVRATPDPVAKRAIIGDFLSRMDRGLGMAKHAVSERDQPKIDLMRTDVQAKYAELNGLNGTPKVGDAELDHFAGYVQQDMEQARVYVEEGGPRFYFWGGGVIILFLILFIILAEGPYYGR